MVKVEPDRRRAQIDAWVAGRGLKVERQRAKQGNWFWLATPARDATLHKPNAIFGPGDVLAASSRLGEADHGALKGRQLGEKGKRPRLIPAQKGSVPV